MINDETPTKRASIEMNIQNYLYDNKEIEATCEEFIESLFLVDPKKFDSLGQTHLKIRKMYYQI